jgi:hypothetical protein
VRKAIGEDGYYHSSEVAGFRIKPEWLWLDPLPRVRQVLAEIEAIS